MNLEIDINPRYRHFIRVMVATIICTVVFSIIYLSSSALVKVNPLPHLQYNTYECLIDDNKSEQAFRIHGLAKINILLADFLCKKSTLTPEINKVILQWNQDDINHVSTLSEMRYDLVALKPDRLSSEQFKLLSNYVKVADYKSYSSYLISRTNQPIMSYLYLADQTIGLLSKKTSFSGNIIPLSFFRRNNINLKNLSIKYFPSHSALRKALKNNEVSVIASYWQDDSDRKRFPTAKLLKLPYDIEPHSWYLNRDYIGTTVHCSVEYALRYQAQKASSTYFKDINIVTSCLKGSIK